jgi:hypothetical protein
VFTPVAIGTATADDVCDPSPAVASNAAELFPKGFPLGTSTVTWTATTVTAIDDNKNKGFATQKVTVADTHRRNLTVTLSPTVLWPPDHKLIPITATITVSDTCDPNPTVKLSRSRATSPTTAWATGTRQGDIQGADRKTPHVHAPRGAKRKGERADLHGHLPSHGRQQQHHDQDGHRDRPKSQAASK